MKVSRMKKKYKRPILLDAEALEVDGEWSIVFGNSQGTTASGYTIDPEAWEDFGPYFASLTDDELMAILQQIDQGDFPDKHITYEEAEAWVDSL